MAAARPLHHGAVTSLRILVLAIGVAIGAFYPFVSVILSSFGFEPGQIGLLTSMGALAFTLSVPAWGHLADVRFGRPRTLQICVAGAVMALVLLLGTWSLIVVSILFIVFWTFQSSWQSLADAITVNALRDRSRGYARVRLLTSLSFATGAVAAGFLYNETGYRPAFVICAVFAIVMALASTRIPDVGRADLSAHRTVPQDPSAASVSPSDLAVRIGRRRDPDLAATRTRCSSR